MRVLAVITARGGSKRLPRKNILPLGGQPLIVWSIEAVRGLNEICDILVSTDDEDIAQVARVAGACVPWLRPAELSSDTASSVDVCLHALDWYESENGEVDGLLLLQPTSPFRSAATVKLSLNMFALQKYRPVVSVTAANSHPECCYRLEESNMRIYFDCVKGATRSQDLPPAYVLDGSIYLIQPNQLRSTRTFCPENTQHLLIKKPWESLDIDTKWDWFIAEKIVENIDELDFL